MALCSVIVPAFNAEAFTDHYDKALRALIEEKRKSGTVKRARTGDDDDGPAKGTNVIDLMAALKKSLGDEKKGAKKAPAKKTAAKTRRWRSSGWTNAPPSSKASLTTRSSRSVISSLDARVRIGEGVVCINTQTIECLREKAQLIRKGQFKAPKTGAFTVHRLRNLESVAISILGLPLK